MTKIDLSVFPGLSADNGFVTESKACSQEHPPARVMRLRQCVGNVVQLMTREEQSGTWARIYLHVWCGEGKRERGPC